MIPVLLVALGGGTVVALVASQRRRLTLLDRLTPPHQAPKTQAVSPKRAPDATAKSTSTHPPGSIPASLARLDEEYQTLVQTHLDPLIAGRLRDQQMLALTEGARRELNPREKRTNRSLALGASGLMLIGLMRLTAWPLTPAVVALGVYNAWPGVQEGWRIAVEERRFSLMHLMLIYLGSLWFGGNYSSAHSESSSQAFVRRSNC
jgi:hypothetical protein